ncbi:hypothetical protein HDV03_004598 [Kappamyces sp. JEL0829]|nr:hypothetical protein HDV03_004598 [Kappamyces sp. JEL0829]
MSFAGAGESSIPLQEASQANSALIANAIYVIASNTAKIQKGVESYGTARDSKELRQEVSSLIDETKKRIKSAGGELQAFAMAQNNLAAKVAQKKLSRDFEHVVDRFQQVSRAAIQKTREAIWNARQPVSHDVEESAEDAPLLGAGQKYDVDRVFDHQIELNERIIAEREEDLQGLEQSIAEVNEIFRDLGSLVNEQQYLLDNIETNVNNVNINMEGAAGELRQASSYQQSTGKTYLWIFLILFVVTLTTAFETRLVDAVQQLDMKEVTSLIHAGARVEELNTPDVAMKEYINGETETVLTKACLAKEKKLQKIMETETADLEMQLPSDPKVLKKLLVQSLVHTLIQQERSKDSIRQLVEEKHYLVYKCRIFEVIHNELTCKKNAGIPDAAAAQTYLQHMQYWQEETERQAITISELKGRLKQLDASAQDQKMFFTQVIEHQKEDSKKEALEKRKSIVVETAGLVADKKEERRVSEETDLSTPVPPQRPHSQLSQSESPDICLIKTESGQATVKCGTVAKLIERLLDPMIHDNHYTQTFLLNYRAFCESHELLEKISNNFKSSDEAAKPALPQQLKAINVLKYWIEQFWNDFQGDDVLLAKLGFYVNLIENAKLAQTLRTIISRKMTGQEPNVIDMPTDCPKPILPKQLLKATASKESTRPVSINWNAMVTRSEEPTMITRLKLVDLDPLEAARQLTLIEFELFCKIKPREFVGLSWMKDDKETRAPNIIKMVRWSNHVIQWLVTEIVSQKDNIKQRAVMMEKIITMAKHCNALNNLNGVKEILAALQSSAVYRLKKTREAMGSKYLKTLEELKTLTASEMNFKNLRAKVHAVEPPLIPFPGVYQGDLVFLETCGKDILDGGMINFLKFQKIASYVIELQTYQRVAYHLQAVPEIQDMIRDFPGLSEEHAYGLSLICEPRAS